MHHGSAHVGVLLFADVLFLLILFIRVLRGERYHWRWRI
jgi:uncharacterized membrane protein